MTTQPNLDELEARLDAATPGPWQVSDGDYNDPKMRVLRVEANNERASGFICRVTPQVDGSTHISRQGDMADPWRHEADARLIVAACNALPALIAAARELEQVKRERDAMAALLRWNAATRAALSIGDMGYVASWRFGFEWAPTARELASKLGLLPPTPESGSKEGG